jgi:hypothetical protein
VVCFFIPLPAVVAAAVMKKDPLPYQRATDTHGRAALAGKAEMLEARACVISDHQEITYPPSRQTINADG